MWISRVGLEESQSSVVSCTWCRLPLYVIWRGALKSPLLCCLFQQQSPAWKHSRSSLWVCHQLWEEGTRHPDDE